MSTISASTTSTTAYKVTADTTGTLVLQTGATPTTAVTIDASQNVGIGTSSPDRPLTVVSATSAGANPWNASQTNLYDSRAMAAGVGGTLQFSGKYTTGGAQALLAWIRGSKTNSTDNDFYGDLLLGARNGAIKFYTASTPTIDGTNQVVTIDVSGNFLVGTTSTSIISGWSMSANAIIGNGNFSGGGGMGVNSTSSTGTQYFIGFGRGGSNCGSITSTTTNSTSYLTSSDYRLKENVQPMTGALAKVAQLNPCTYTWKEDGTSGQGFIAHELQSIVPEAVSGEKDAIDVEGNPRYQGVDTSFLVATLTAAIKEQQAIITQLQADVAALKGA